MYAAALLIATAAVGVDTGWRPAQDDPESVQYIIQIEPEVLQKMLRDGTPIDSIVPPDVHGGVIRCFRVQLGEDELPRELPEVTKATYNAEIDNDSATLRKVEAEPLQLNPAPDNRAAASTATPPLDALAADIPTPRYSNTLSPGSGTPLNPTRTANAADANPSLSGSSNNFSIPGSTTTPVGGSTPTNRFSTAPLSTNSSASTTYQGSSGYSGGTAANPNAEYPNYSPPPLSTSTTPLGGSTSPLGGNSTNNDSGYGRFGDTFATPTNGGQSGSGTNYGGNSYPSGLNNSGNGTTNNSGSNLGNTYQGSLTPINSAPPQNNQNNNNGSNNNGSYVPPSNQQQQQPPNNNYQQPAPNYPPQQQQPFPYNQPGYVNTYGQMANPNYYPQMGYPPQYNPYLMAALPGMGAPALTPPAQQQPPATQPTATTPPPASSPSDRTTRDLDDNKDKTTEQAEVPRPYWMLTMVAFLSLGFNIYMGWMVIDFRTKYRDILAGFRELKAAN